MIDLKIGDVKYFTNDIKKYTVFDVAYYTKSGGKPKVKEKFFLLQDDYGNKERINANLRPTPYDVLWSTTKRDAVKKKIRLLEKQATLLREMYL